MVDSVFISEWEGKGVDVLELELEFKHCEVLIAVFKQLELSNVEFGNLQSLLFLKQNVLLFELLTVFRFIRNK